MVEHSSVPDSEGWCPGLRPATPWVQIVGRGKPADRRNIGYVAQAGGNCTAKAISQMLSRFARVCLLIAATASNVGAQELASSFDQLRILVKPGDTVNVTDGKGQETRGKISALSSSSLELTVAGTPRAFLESEVRTIRQRRADSLKNGALWGLAIGAGLGAIPQYDGGWYYTSENVGAAIGLALFGLGVGTGIDAMIRNTDVIYSRPAGASATLSVSPLLVGDRKGVSFSIGF